MVFHTAVETDFFLYNQRYMTSFQITPAHQMQSPENLEILGAFSLRCRKMVGVFSNPSLRFTSIRA
jgi:hypothetical protein